MNSRWLALPVLLAMIGFGALPAGAQAPDSVAAAGAERFLGLLKGNDWAAAGEMVAPAIRDRLGAAQLEAIWAQLEGGLGALKSTRLRSVTPAEGARAVELLAEFERQTMLVRVVVSPEQQVVGFWVGPVPNAEAEPAAAPPPPYADVARFREEEVDVGSDPWLLPGTLTLPVGPGPHPAVVLVHGSGPHDRDETVGGAKVFRDLAWGLASRGIAVLRYEKRTRVHGAKMTSGVNLDTEVIDDAVAGLALLRSHPSVDGDRLFVVGHSLGATLAPAIAARDGRVAGAVLLAATARPIDKVMLEQLEYLATLPQNSSAAARAQLSAAAAQVRRLASGEAPDDELVMGAPASYFRELARKDGVADAARIDIPLLILQGERDYQVTMTDFGIWRDAMKSRPDATLHSFPTLNHLFVAGTGAPDPAEYMKPGFVAQEVVDMIADWIRHR